MESGFEKLEEHIGQAMRKISSLRQERDELRERRKEIEAQMERLQDTNLELQNELERVRESTVAKDEFEARKAEIERRVESLLSRFDELETDVGKYHEAIVELMASYLEGGHPFPERTHLSVLFATFQIEMFKSIERWIQFAREEIGQWPTTRNIGMNPRTEALTRLLAQDESALDNRLPTPTPGDQQPPR